MIFMEHLIESPYNCYVFTEIIMLLFSTSKRPSHVKLDSTIKNSDKACLVGKINYVSMRHLLVS